MFVKYLLILLQPNIIEHLSTIYRMTYLKLQTKHDRMPKNMYISPELNANDT